MIIYFSLYCFLGYLMESLYVSFLRKKWISSGLLKGPFIPLYGIGASLLIAMRPYLTYHPLFSFFIGGALMTLLEYLSGIYIEKYFHTKCWDYSKHKFNYQGRICFLYFMIWSFLSYVFLYFIHPFIESQLILNDTTCIISLIYIAFLLKSFTKRIQFSRNNGLDIQ